MRPPFVGHRRYSITHRAVQRLRELCPGRDDEDDETLRDRLDEALGSAEDSGRAIRTLDAMLGEPQTLIPIDAFGDLLYAIIKEDTVVTVLPRGHGEEILQRGQAMEQRVASGQVSMRHPDRDRDRDKDRWGEAPRRRWQKDTQSPVVIERIVRGNGIGGNGTSAMHDEHEHEHDEPGRRDYSVASEAGFGRRPEPSEARRAEPVEQRVADPSALVVRIQHVPTARAGVAQTVDPGARDLGSAMGPVTKTLHDALELGRRRAAVTALREALLAGDREDSLLPLWNALAEHGIPQSLTVGDLLDAVRGLE